MLNKKHWAESRIFQISLAMGRGSKPGWSIFPRTIAWSFPCGLGEHSLNNPKLSVTRAVMFLKHVGSVVSVQASCCTLWCNASQCDHLDYSNAGQNHTVACQLIGSPPVSDEKRWATYGGGDATDWEAKGCQLLRTTHPTLVEGEEHLASVEPESWNAFADRTPGNIKSMGIPKEDRQVLVLESVFWKPLPVHGASSIKGCLFSFIQKVGQVHGAWNILDLSHTGHMLGFQGYFFWGCNHVVWWLRLDSGCDVLLDFLIHLKRVVEAICRLYMAHDDVCSCPSHTKVANISTIILDDVELVLRIHQALEHVSIEVLSGTFSWPTKSIYIT